jgi:hypothetical protein
MKQLVIEPDGWPCRYDECRPGLFMFHECLSLMSEYGKEAYLEASGEIFWGGVSSKEARAALIVQPVRANWQEVDQ